VATFRKYLFRFLPLGIALLALGVLVWWFLYNPVQSFSLAVPGMDNRSSQTISVTETVNIGEFFEYFGEEKPVSGSRWPGFRGPGRDNINKEPVRLLDSWGDKNPEIIWKIDLGEGHAAPAVYDGKVYLLDYDEVNKADALRCFSLKTGKELWKRWYHVRLKRNHGLSRTIPAVSGNYIVTIGPRCQVMCVERISGKYLWGIDLGKTYGTEIPFWYTGQCPLLRNDTAVIAVGGKVLMIGIDCRTGKVAWETPNPHNWKMSHSSIMPVTWKGKTSYIYCAVGGVCGISAEAPDKGKILWETAEFSPSVIAPSPVVLENGRLFVTAGYGYGGALLQVQESDGKYRVNVLQQYKPSEGLVSEQQTPVFVDGYLYGIMPKDAGGLRSEFVCVHPGNPKKIIMRSGKTARFGLGPYILADGKFFILNDDGEMTIVKLSHERFTVLDRKRIIDGQDTWGPIAIAGGYLLMRDSKQLVCLDIRAK